MFHTLLGAAIVLSSVVDMVFLLIQYITFCLRLCLLMLCLKEAKWEVWPISVPCLLKKNAAFAKCTFYGQEKCILISCFSPFIIFVLFTGQLTSQQHSRLLYE